LKGVNYFFAKKLILMGIGFRCWTIFSKNNKFIVIKASLSKDIIVHIPSEIDIFCFNNTSLIIFGFKKQNVYLFISKIKKIKKFNVYKKKGVFFENELVKLKIGKKT
jgi:large subunit ribosomal protein L6